MSKNQTEVREKSARRVLAGRKNRECRGPLSAAGLERLRRAALEHRPWEHSTGPTTEEGKARTAKNGKYRQCHAVSIRQVRRELAEVRAEIAQARETRHRVISDVEAAGLGTDD